MVRGDGKQRSKGKGKNKQAEKTKQRNKSFKDINREGQCTNQS
jgi:hypothetical protein